MISHPTLARMQIRVRDAYDSKATTVKGVLKVIKRRGLPSPPLPDTYVPRKKWVRVPIYDSALAQKANQYAAEKYPRKKRITNANPAVEDGYRCDETLIRYKGKHSGRVNTEIVPRYPSHVKIAKSSRKVAELWQEGKLVCRRFAPKGYHWAWDSLGVMIVDSQGNDYHVTVDEMRGRSFTGIIRKRLTDKKRKQRELARVTANNKRLQWALEKVEKSATSLAKYWVTVEDSLAAGNCRAGTDRFVDQLTQMLGYGIGAVRADFLMQKWNTPAVKNAVRFAVLKKLKLEISNKKKRGKTCLLPSQ